MTPTKIVTLAAAGALTLALGACSSMNGDQPRTAAQAETSNANNINANGSAQPGGAGPAPNGGASNPGTSGTVTNTPGPGPH
jgi:hypothetical protein